MNDLCVKKNTDKGKKVQIIKAFTEVSRGLSDLSTGCFKFSRIFVLEHSETLSLNMMRSTT